MSIRATAWAWEIDLPAVTKLVLLALADCSHPQTGKTFPSQGYIAKKTGLKRLSVNRHLKALVDAGLISASHTFDDSGRQLNNDYILNLNVTGGCMREIHSGVSDKCTGGVSDAYTYPEVEEPEVGTKILDTSYPRPFDDFQGDVPDGGMCSDDEPMPALIPGLPVVAKENMSRKDELSEAVRLWNELADELDLAKMKKFTVARRASMKRRLDDCGGLSGWVAALDKVRSSSFLRGETGWKVTFDFMMQESSFVKLMEGNYEDRKQPPKKLGRTSQALMNLTKEGFFDEDYS